MHRLALMFTGFAALLTWSCPATAGNLYATGFEAPTFQSGQSLVGQDGWVNQIYNGVPLGPDAAVISALHPRDGLQSVRIAGADLTPIDIGYAAGSYRKFLDFDAGAAGFPIVRLQADVRIDGPRTTQSSDRVTGDFFSANLAAFSPDGDLGELSLSSDGHLYGYTSEDSYLFEVPILLGRYYRLALDLDFAARTTTFLLDGQVLGTRDFDPTFASNFLSRGSMVTYALDPDPLDRDRGAYAAYYDNVSVATVPEPSTLTLGALGAATSALGLLRRRRRTGRAEDARPRMAR